MALTQESLLSVLRTEGGKVKKSDLVGKFKGVVDCHDPAEKQRNRELFKTLVNNVAFVKEIDGVRYVVLKKIHQHLPDGVRTAEQTENKEIPPTGEQQQERPPARSEKTESRDDAGAASSAVPEPKEQQEGGGSCESCENPLQLALQRSKDVGVKKMPNFQTQKEETIGESCPRRRGAGSEPTRVQSKPYALPLRVPPSSTRVEIRKLKVDPDGPPESPVDISRAEIHKLKADPDGPPESPVGVTRVEIHKLKVDPDGPPESPVDITRAKNRKLKADPDGPPESPVDISRAEIRKLKADPPESPTLDSSRSKRRPPSEGMWRSIGSPQLRRAEKSTKASDEPKETRAPSAVPLEQSEHEWLVKCAAGHWNQAYGLLLRDHQLAEKRDFMSGFTALHWAAKCGNSRMLVKIIDLAKEGGVDIDINAKTHGGYTPLHIAALHDQEYIMAMLLGELGADPSIRDNCGKKAYHYVHKGISVTLREMLCEPKVQQTQDRAQHEREEPGPFPDRSKGRHTISRLFQPQTTSQKKKHKLRLGLYSLSEDPSEDREDGSSFRHRIMSEVFS